VSPVLAQLNDEVFEEPFGASLARSFELIALKNEYGPDHWMPVRKWEKPVSLYIDSRSGMPEIHRELVQDHIVALAKITGHQFSLVKQRKQANTLVVFDQEENLRALVKELLPKETFTDKFLNTSVCFAFFDVDSHYAIKRAVVIIPNDRARAYAKLPACVVEELTQIMGLINDSVEVYPSIFNDKSIDNELSLHDVSLLKLLYSSRIKAGMRRQQVMPIVRELIPRIVHERRGEDLGY